MLTAATATMHEGRAIGDDSLDVARQWREHGHRATRVPAGVVDSSKPDYWMVGASSESQVESGDSAARRGSSVRPVTDDTFVVPSGWMAPGQTHVRKMKLKAKGYDVACCGGCASGSGCSGGNGDDSAIGSIRQSCGKSATSGGGGCEGGNADKSSDAAVAMFDAEMKWASWFETAGGVSPEKEEMRVDTFTSVPFEGGGFWPDPQNIVTGECCCCPIKLELRKLRKSKLRTKNRKIEICGHRFEVAAFYGYKGPGPDERHCKLEWWEIATEDLPELGRKGFQFYDAVAIAHRRENTTRTWRERLNEKGRAACPAMKEVVLEDVPFSPRDRVLNIFVYLTGAPDCGCDPAQLKIHIKQVIHYDSGTCDIFVNPKDKKAQPKNPPKPPGTPPATFPVSGLPVHNLLEWVLRWSDPEPL